MCYTAGSLLNTTKDVGICINIHKGQCQEIHHFPQSSPENIRIYIKQKLVTPKQVLVLLLIQSYLLYLFCIK